MKRARYNSGLVLQNELKSNYNAAIHVEFKKKIKKNKTKLKHFWIAKIHVAV